jgi:hypothetical protein
MGPSDPSRAGQDPTRPLAQALTLAPSGPVAGRALQLLTALAVAATFTVASPLLDLLGIPYAAPTGSFLCKLHPATWLIAAAYAVALAGCGNPLRELGRSLAHQPATAVYLASVLLMLVWSLVRFGASGTAFFIDTLLMPGVLALLLARLDLATQRWLFNLLCGLVMGNTLLGIGEQLTEMRLIPLTFGNDIVMVEDLFRATALLGHPLWAASVTGFALFVLYRLRGRVVRSLCCLVLVLALLSFGGRTSLATNLALIAPLALFDLARHARRTGLSYAEVTGGTAVAVLALGTVVAAVMGGSVGERIVGSLDWDSSAQVRTKMIEVFHYMDWQQFLFGMNPVEIHSISAHLGLVFPEGAIESFWIVLCMQVGVPLLALFALALAAFFLRLARLGGIAVGLGLVAFLLVASTSISLAVKSPILVAVVALAYLAGTYRWCGLQQEACRRLPAGPASGRAPAAPARALSATAAA